MKKFLIAVFLICISIVTLSSADTAYAKKVVNKDPMIVEYENAIDIYNLDNKFDDKDKLKELFETAQKLQKLDPKNVMAFRATVYYYRKQGAIKTAVDYCKATAKEKLSTELAIDAYYQLGDMYRHEWYVEFYYQKFTNRALLLVKNKYSKADIEKFVNEADVLQVNGTLVGKTNTVRNLYALKSEIENVNPELIQTDKDGVYRLKYRTNW